MADSPLAPVRARAVRTVLEEHPRRMIDAPARRAAAVLILLFERDGEPWVVLTKRTETVRTHKGEISFPGGARDPEDDDLWRTALRETVEELGIAEASVARLGALDDYPTFASGFVVSPFVATFDPAEGFAPSAHEIADVIELPLAMLAAVGKTETWERQGIIYPMHLFDVDRHRVWGVTAFILRRFLDMVGPALGLGGTEAMGTAETVVKELADRFDRFDWVGIYWVEGDDLVLGPSVGLHPEGHERIRIPEGVCGAVAASGRTEVVPDVRKRPGHIACDLSTRSEAVAPIRRDGRVVGVLDVDSNTPDAFGESEVSAVEEAAGRIGSNRS